MQIYQTCCKPARKNSSNTTSAINQTPRPRINPNPKTRITLPCCELISQNSSRDTSPRRELTPHKFSKSKLPLVLQPIVQNSPNHKNPRKTIAQISISQIQIPSKSNKNRILVDFFNIKSLLRRIIINGELR